MNGRVLAESQGRLGWLEGDGFVSQRAIPSAFGTAEAGHSRPVEAFVQSGECGLLALAQGMAWHVAQRGERRFRFAGAGVRSGGACIDHSGLYYVGVPGTDDGHEPVIIKCWRPEWDEWQVFHEFRSGYIRHIHTLQYDPYADRVWVTTGDRDSESFIGYFDSRGEPHALTLVASSSQMARTMRLIFTSEYIYWGTHYFHLTPNRLFRWERRSSAVQLCGAVRGPVYDATADESGRLFISSSAESSGRPGVGQARVLMSEDGRRWHEVACWLGGDGLGGAERPILRFPQYAASDGRLLVSGSGIRGGSGTWLLEV